MSKEEVPLETVIWVDPKKLKVAPTNVRVEEIPSEEKEKMRRSVEHEGIKQPIIINENYEVVSGGVRWSAALAAGLERVPCIMRHFDNKYEERITCMLQDFFHHPVSQRAKHLFVKKCIEEDGMTIKDIAKSLGVTEFTVRRWANYNWVPEQIKDKPKYKQMYLLTPGKKKRAIESVLKHPEFKDDINRSLQLIEMTREAGLRELESIKKDINTGLWVDLDFRRKLANMETALIEVKIPKRLDLLFRKKLRIERKDFNKVLVDLIQKYVDGEVEV